MIARTCCFVGHRTIEETNALKEKVYTCVEKMISELHIDTFLFGSKSRFNELCWEIVTEMKEKHPQIKRVYVRAEFPVIDDDYKQYLLERYEDTYYPETIVGAGKSIYVERNCEMIKNSRFCVIYVDEKYSPDARKSGTKTVLAYACKQGKHIVRLP